MNTSQQMEINRMKLAIYGYRPDWKYYRHGCREEDDGTGTDRGAGGSRIRMCLRFCWPTIRPILRRMPAGERI